MSEILEKTYDVMQVCEKGHKITGCYKTEPKRRQKFCSKCGAKSMTVCPNCQNEIQGDQYFLNPHGTPINTKRVYVPSYCRNCGEPYPWTKSKIATAIQIFKEFGNLDEEEKKTIDQDIENIAQDVPETELSSMRIKRIWEKCSRAGYKVIMEFASCTAANILKNPQAYPVEKYKMKSEKMRFSVGLWDALFGEKVTCELPAPGGQIIKRQVTKKWLVK